MQVKTILFAAALSMAPGVLQAQVDFKLDGRDIQVHGFVSQGFSYTDDNNWLTMQTSNGSFAMTDGGLNISTQLTDKFRVGAQVYDRDFGRLGKWHPILDWALGDYRFAPWFGVRAGKVKTTLGLYNDTQDMDSLRTFALLPQGVYATDMRDSTLAHVGGDVYGTISPRRLGSLSYTGYVGDNIESIYGGYPELLQIHGIYINHSSGLTWGGDLRWNTPVKGLLVGASYENNDIRNTGSLNPSVALGGPDVSVPYWEASRREFIQQFYGEYVIGNLRLDAEFRRYWRDFTIFNGQFEVTNDPKSWYASADYRLSKRLAVGAYYSHYVIDWVVTAPGQVESPSTSAPDRHLYDKVAALRFDITSNWYAKIEGHFMDGYGGFQYPDGFYPVVNQMGACPNGQCQALKPKTNALVIRTGWSF
jgi:hypothetical protein